VSRSRLAVVVLAVASIAALGLRVGAVEAKPTLSHDEAISYVAATCHQAEYEQTVLTGRYPVARWAPAADWQRLFEPNDALCFGRIAGGLAAHDIHPPLYFWALHLWTLAAGTGVARGALLNLGLVLLTMLALFGLATRVLRDRLDAALAASLWAVSPAVVAISSEARQYDLLALVSVLCVWQALRLAEAPPGRAGGAAALLGVATAAGALTHYHFALVAVAAAGVLALRLRQAPPGAPRRARLRRLALGVGALAGGYAVFIAAHPGFLESFARQEGQASSPSAAGLGLRVDRTVSAFAEFFVGKLESAALAYLAFGCVVAVGCAIALLARSAQKGRTRDGEAGAERLMLLVFVWLAGTTVLLYLTFVSPVTAMGGRYLATCWPFLALVIVGGLRGAGGLRPALGLAVVVAVAACSVAELVELHSAADRRARSALATARGALVIDTVRRGLLPAIILDTPASRPVFAADQRSLLDRKPLWLPQVDADVAFASTLSYVGFNYPRRRLVKTLREKLGPVRAREELRLWDSARLRGPLEVQVYRFGEADSRRRSIGRPARGRQSRSR
jgi:hypothetical protein